MTSARAAHTNNDITGPLTSLATTPPFAPASSTATQASKWLSAAMSCTTSRATASSGGGRALFRTTRSSALPVGQGDLVTPWPATTLPGIGYGIQVSGGTISGNRVVHNAAFGIQIFNGGE